jgi:hypothetical protein
MTHLRIHKSRCQSGSLSVLCALYRSGIAVHRTNNTYSQYCLAKLLRIDLYISLDQEIVSYEGATTYRMLLVLGGHSYRDLVDQIQVSQRILIEKEFIQLI